MSKANSAAKTDVENLVDENVISPEHATKEIAHKIWVDTETVDKKISKDDVDISHDHKSDDEDDDDDDGNDSDDSDKGQTQSFRVESDSDEEEEEEEEEEKEEEPVKPAKNSSVKVKVDTKAPVKSKAKAKKVESEDEDESEDDAEDGDSEEEEEEGEHESDSSESEDSSDESEDDDDKDAEDSDDSSDESEDEKSKKSKKSYRKPSDPSLIDARDLDAIINENLNDKKSVIKKIADASVTNMKKTWYNNQGKGEVPTEHLIGGLDDAERFNLKLVPHKTNYIGDQGKTSKGEDRNFQSSKNIFQNYSIALSKDGGKKFITRADIAVDLIIIPPEYYEGIASSSDSTYFSYGVGYKREFVEYIEDQLAELVTDVSRSSPREYELTAAMPEVRVKFTKKNGEVGMKKKVIDRNDLSIMSQTYNRSTKEGGGSSASTLETKSTCTLDTFNNWLRKQKKGDTGDKRTYKLSDIVKWSQTDGKSSKSKSYAMKSHRCVWGPGTVTVAVTFSYEDVKQASKKNKKKRSKRTSKKLSSLTLDTDDEAEEEDEMPEGDDVYGINDSWVRVTSYNVRITPKNVRVLGYFDGQISPSQPVTDIGELTMFDSDSSDDESKKKPVIKDKKSSKPSTKTKKTSKSKSSKEDSKKSKKSKKQESESEHESDEESEEEEAPKPKKGKKAVEKSKDKAKKQEPEKKPEEKKKKKKATEEDKKPEEVGKAEKAEKKSSKKKAKK